MDQIADVNLEGRIEDGVTAEFKGESLSQAIYLQIFLSNCFTMQIITPCIEVGRYPIKFIMLNVRKS